MPEIRKKVPKRIAQTVISSLKGGVVPRIGLPYIAVGRKNEIEALLHDVEVITEGGASFRFIVGAHRKSLDEDKAGRRRPYTGARPLDQQCADRGGSGDRP